MAQKYYNDYEKEILGRQGMFDPKDIESGKVKLDPNYGLYEAKKGYESSTNPADKTYYGNMGKYFRSHGATLDPNNTMNAKQYSNAYWGQFGMGTQPQVHEAYKSSETPSTVSEYGSSVGYAPSGDYFSQQQGYINNYLSQMNNYMQQYNAAGLQMLRDYQANYAQALDQLRSLMERKPEVPESVKTAIDIMKQQTAENAKAIDEQLNAMGVLYSGRTGQEHDKLYRNLDNQTRTLLSNWLDQQHNQMYQAALKLADMQAGYARDYANLSAQYQLGAIDKAMGLAGQQYNMLSGLTRDQQNYDLQLRQMAAQQQAAANKQYWDNYWNQMKYSTPTAGEQLQYEAALRRLEAANARANAAKASSVSSSNQLAQEIYDLHRYAESLKDMPADQARAQAEQILYQKLAEGAINMSAYDRLSRELDRIYPRQTQQQSSTINKP